MAGTVEGASLYRHRVVIQELTIEQDVFGGPVETWTDGPALFASVEPLRGKEFYAWYSIPQAEASVDARIRIRFRTGLNPGQHRVIHGPTVYDLVAVIQDVDHQQTQLMVRARKMGQGPGQEVNA